MMDAISYALILVPLAVMALMARSANRLYQAHARLPMQWQLSGEVSWSAPRKIALSLIPALAAISLIFLAFISSAAPQESRWLMLGITAVAYLAVFALHLRLLRARVGP